jgi:hypothetical protein
MGKKFCTAVEFGPSERTQTKYKSETAPFIAWDSEGYTDDDGNHHMTLFGNSEDQYITGESLTWFDCIELMLNAPKGNHVIFAGTYDVIMMIKQLPYVVRQRLHDDKVVIYRGYRLHWIKRKWFHIIHRASHRSIKLYDVFTFFGTSFVKACVEYLGDDDTLRAMAETKKLRNTFTFNDPRVLPYWQQELAYLVKLMNRLRELLLEVGIVPRGWHGPGAIATALLKAHKVNEHQGDIPPVIVDIAERAYYGGRFEQYGIGRVRDVNEYDIRSAYPCFIAQLPSWNNVRWEHYEYGNAAHDCLLHPFGLYCVSWDIQQNLKSIGPLPWRDKKGNIYYPTSGSQSWYWGIEIHNLADLGHGRIHEAWIPVDLTMKGSHHTLPFKWIQQMYDDRASMKAAGNPAQLALKLGMNSIYGKLAQSVGAVQDHTSKEWKKPPFHNVLWAGWITAATRRQLFKWTYKQGAGKVIAYETDAIYTVKELPVPISTVLGGWDHTRYDEIIYVQSGVYFARTGDKWKLRSRGIELDYSPDIAQWERVLETLPEKQAELRSTRPCFITDIRSKQYGKWVIRTRTTMFGSPVLSKRMHFKESCVACSLQLGSYNTCMHNMIVPEPINDMSSCIPSTPYKFPWRTDVEYFPEFKIEAVQVVDLDNDMLDWREVTQEDWEIDQWITGKDD